MNSTSAKADACIDKLLERQDKDFLEIYTNTGETALHLATEAGYLHGVKALVKAGANIHCQEKINGRTVKEIAYDKNHEDIIKFLKVQHKTRYEKQRVSHYPLKRLSNCPTASNISIKWLSFFCECRGNFNF